jgi:hypothetical protein
MTVDREVKMKKNHRGLLLCCLLVFLTGCASIDTSAKNYVEAGMIYRELANNQGIRYFVAYGRVNQYGLFWVVGQTNTNVIVQIQPESGRIIRILTLQPGVSSVNDQGQDGLRWTSRNQRVDPTEKSVIYEEYVGDLIGGILVYDIWPVSSLNDAVNQLM